MTEKDIKLENAHILYGDAMNRLKELPDNSVDSIVTDPPYGLTNTKGDLISKMITEWTNGNRSFVPDGKGFMGKEWDGSVPPPAIWDECMRVLKPGGHLLAFFGSRTQDIGALSIRLAGFEIRDSIAWVYGSGFPKSMNISLQLDKQAGLQGNRGSAINVGGKGDRVDIETSVSEANGKLKPEYSDFKSDAAKQWQGWGTALKPAVEPIVVARKPLSEKTVANNVLKWGTGGLNIAASRIASTDGFEKAWDKPVNTNIVSGVNGAFSKQKQTLDLSANKPTGRFPANIILDEEAAELLDEQSGISKSQVTNFKVKGRSGGILGKEGKDRDYISGHNDSGGASRFFYVAKASKKDRNEGMTDTTNYHPTVKPTTLMEYLIKLVTPVGGTVLDPFTGSGSTGKAALLNGFKFIGCEVTEEYLPIIDGRLKLAADKYAKEQAKKAETLFQEEE